METITKTKTGSRRKYPSDITREQFGRIEAELAGARKETRPRSYDLYDVFCAVLYVLREGCRWRSLPHDFPKWQNVYYHFQIWKEPDGSGESLLGRMLRRLVGEQRVKDGRAKQTSMVIADARSVKNADTSEEGDYDAGKKNLGDKDPHSHRHRGAAPRHLR